MGLHPQGIAAVLLMVLELLRRGYRVVISTHSPVVLEMVWALQEFKKLGADESDVRRLFDLKASTPAKELGKTALVKDYRVYHLRPAARSPRHLESEPWRRGYRRIRMGRNHGLLVTCQRGHRRSGGPCRNSHKVTTLMAASRKRTGPPVQISAFEAAARAAGMVPCTGLSAVKAEYRSGVSLKPEHRHTASIDTDAHFHDAEPAAARWDYGLGLRTQSGEELMVWLEPHPASSTGEVQKMLDKLDWLKSKVAQTAFDGLRTLELTSRRRQIILYRWLAPTGSIRILPNSKEARRLAQAGLSQPQRHVQLP